ncbi:Ubiquitin-conjugating enzyme E2 J1 [Lamellibrachia satsuma]|nr:Ubiquitin-conjugating enzyme E2 J1 [Lamellibrachia satsuma]
MDGQYNLRSPAVKRLMREAQELRQPTEQYFAQPLEDNLFEWHFTIRGPVDTAFDRGIYHGRIVLPPDYPMKPPSIILLTPNGRFETNKKICLSISGHHPESWQPSWSIRTALLAIIGFMPTHGSGAIGSLDYTPDERKVLAMKSLEWKCPQCGDVTGTLLPVTEASKETTKEAEELASQIDFQGEKDKSTGDTKDKSSPPPASQTSLPDSTATSPISVPSPASARHSTQIPPTSPFTHMQRFNPHMYTMPFLAPRLVPPAFPGARTPSGVTRPQRWPTQYPGAVPRGNVMYWSYTNPLHHPAMNTAATAVPSTSSSPKPTATMVTTPVTIMPVTTQSSSAATSQPITTTPATTSLTTTPTTTPTTPPTSTPTTTTVPDSGLRRRHVLPSVQRQQASAELVPTRSSRGGDHILLLLTVVIGLLLAALMLRRLLKLADVL